MYLLELVGEDDAFAIREAASVCDGVERLAPGVATATTVDRVPALALTRTACALVGTSGPTLDAARTTLETADLAPDGIVREGTIRVRARVLRGSVDVSTAAVERALGSVLVARGYDVDLDDPDHELRVLFADDCCAFGWTVATAPRDFGHRDPGKRPFFQPGSMMPDLARALVNLAGGGPGTRLLDPMCGTGGTLIEAGLVGCDVLGSDVQWKMVRGTTANLDWAGIEGDVVRADATHLPFAAGAADAAVFDAPYGRQSKIVGDLDELVTAALTEARRVATDACVIVADRRWDAAATTAGWAVEAVFDRYVHGSMTRYVHVLE